MYYQTAPGRDCGLYIRVIAKNKKGSYKTHQVVWWADKRKPDKAKIHNVQSFEIDTGFYRPVALEDLPIDVQNRFADVA